MVREEIEAGFREVRLRQFLKSRLDDLRSPDYWRKLNPQLAISERPFECPPARTQVAPEISERAAQQLMEEGYFQTPPLLAEEEMEPLRTGIQRIVEAGFPSGMACLYDEF